MSYKNNDKNDSLYQIANKIRTTLLLFIDKEQHKRNKSLNKKNSSVSTKYSTSVRLTMAVSSSDCRVENTKEEIFISNIESSGSLMQVTGENISQNKSEKYKVIEGNIFDKCTESNENNIRKGERTDCRKDKTKGKNNFLY